MTNLAVGSAPPAADAGGREAIEELRTALSHVFGAERRLRGRDHGFPDDLTHAHIRSLAALGRQGEMTAGELARSADLNPASVTAMVDHLEDAGIVKRNRSTVDRRVCNVSLTPKGRELLDRRLAAWRELWTARLQGYSDAEVSAAARIMQEIAGMFDAISTPD